MIVAGLVLPLEPAVRSPEERATPGAVTYSAGAALGSATPATRDFIMLAA